MSFVYAFKFNKGIYMYGDTKVIIGDSGTDNFKETRRLVEKLGILKTIILSNNIALGFSGNNICYVDDALKKIFNNKIDLDYIVNILKFYSAKEYNAPDFILAYKNDYLIKISNGEIEERDNCYIGSPDAFNYLQTQKAYERIEPGLISEIFSNLIEKNIDNDVGKFYVGLHFDLDNNRFEYLERFWSEVINIGYIAPNETLPLFANAQNGGYTYQLYPIYNDSETQYLAIKFLQNDKIYAFIPATFIPKHTCQYPYLFLPYDIDDL